MSKGRPSMVALLGLLAVAGFQNRDKIGAMMKNATDNAPASGAQTGMLGQLASMFGGNQAGGTVSEGLSSLVDRFKASGMGPQADSWVAHGANAPLAENELETAIGADTVSQIAATTGLSREQILKRLSRHLPVAVDHMTPMGRIPSATEAQSLA